MGGYGSNTGSGLLNIDCVAAPPPPIWSEDFESGIPLVWTIWDQLGSSTFGWARYSAHGGTVAAEYQLSGEWVVANSDHGSTASDPYDVVFCTPQLDISGVAAPLLVADVSFRDFSNSAFEVWVSCDNGASGYTMFQQYLTSQMSTTTGHDLSTCAGGSAVVACFRYVNLTDGNDYYANVDNVGIAGTGSVIVGSAASDPTGSVPVELIEMTVE